jgi:hypothetical protein
VFGVDGWGEKTSGQNAIDDFTVDIGETIVAALETVGESGVVHSEQMQEGGVEIVNVDGIFCGLESEFIGGAPDGPGANAATGQPQAVAAVVVIATVVAPCTMGVRPNSPPQTMRVSWRSPRSLRSVTRAAEGLSVSFAFCLTPPVRLPC